MREVCGTCKHNKRTFDGHCNAEFCCGNPESDYYSVPTFYDDTCDKWEDEGIDLGDYPNTIPNQFDNMTGSMNI